MNKNELPIKKSVILLSRTLPMQEMSDFEFSEELKSNLKTLKDQKRKEILFYLSRLIHIFDKDEEDNVNYTKAFSKDFKIAITALGEFVQAIPELFCKTGLYKMTCALEGTLSEKDDVNKKILSLVESSLENKDETPVIKEFKKAYLRMTNDLLSPGGNSIDDMLKLDTILNTKEEKEKVFFELGRKIKKQLDILVEKIENASSIYFDKDTYFEENLKFSVNTEESIEFFQKGKVEDFKKEFIENKEKFIVEKANKLLEEQQHVVGEFDLDEFTFYLYIATIDLYNTYVSMYASLYNTSLTNDLLFLDYALAKKYMEKEEQEEAILDIFKQISNLDDILNKEPDLMVIHKYVMLRNDLFTDNMFSIVKSLATFSDALSITEKENKTNSLFHATKGALEHYISQVGNENEDTLSNPINKIMSLGVSTENKKEGIAVNVNSVTAIEEGLDLNINNSIPLTEEELEDFEFSVSSLDNKNILDAASLNSELEHVIKIAFTMQEMYKILKEDYFEGPLFETSVVLLRKYLPNEITEEECKELVKQENSNATVFFLMSIINKGKEDLPLVEININNIDIDNMTQDEKTAFFKKGFIRANENTTFHKKIF